MNTYTFGETQTIKTTPTKCIPGKGPRGPEPQEKCWSGAAADVKSVSEDGKNKYTTNRVEVGLDGKMKVCSKPVPLDRNCKPRWPGSVTYCDMLSGSRECHTLFKHESAGAQMGETLGDFAKNSLNPELQREISARSMEEATRQILLNPGKGVMSFNDPYCILVSCSGEDKVSPTGSRIVTLPADELERIANSPELSRNINTWATALQKTGRQSQLPIFSAEDSYRLAQDSLVRSYMTDSGNQVRIYSGTPEPLESMMPNYGTGQNVPQSYGDTTFRPTPAPSVPLPPVDTYGSNFQKINVPSWVTSATRKVRDWLNI